MMMVLCGFLNTINFVMKGIIVTLLITLQKDCVIQVVLCGKHCIGKFVYIVIMELIHYYIGSY